MYVKLLSSGACANITIREIMLINMISSASWTLQAGRWGGGEGGRELNSFRSVRPQEPFKVPSFTPSVGQTVAQPTMPTATILQQ